MIVEAATGVRLTSDLVVHHRNGDRLDNRLQNLDVMTHADHSRAHNQKHPTTKPCAVCGSIFTPHQTKRARAQTCGDICKRALLSLRCTEMWRKRGADSSPSTTESLPKGSDVTMNTKRSYDEFLAGKARQLTPIGLTEIPALSEKLFPHQRDTVALMLRRGRGAVFFDTGLGKGWIALEWLRVIAEHTGKPVLLLAPLAVSHQFAREAAKFGVPARVVADASEVGPGINITNYHKLGKFDVSVFGGVALDESSILKSFDGKTRTQLIESFKDAPFRLALTATPAPNDFTEFGNHAEFLGVMTRTEMMSLFFVHDGETTSEWRLKGHAADAFWSWVASWAIAIRRPSDLGYDDGAYDLPPLHIHRVVLPVDTKQAFASGMLFASEAATLSDQRTARRASLSARVARCVEIANAANGAVVVWCDLNDEGNALEKSIDGSVQVAGANSDDEKEQKIEAFSTGEARVMISKASLTGHGLNWQHAATAVYCGITNSWEALYQSLKRLHRYGQVKPVNAYIVVSEAETRVLDNLTAKQARADEMIAAMVAAMSPTTMRDLRATSRTMDGYETQRRVFVPQWLIENVEAA